MIWWVWSGLALVAAGGFAYWRSGARTRRRDQRKIRRAVTACLTEDVKVLEADLHQLEYDLGGRYHYPDVRHDYDRVVSSIASARQSISELGELEGAYPITETLAEGRYALACLQARIDGEPLPERRLPCFFNPQHGPSVTDVPWTSYRDQAVDVPACRADAVRIAVGEKPDSREVRTGWRTVPYWDAAAPAFLWYSTGYFGGDWPASPADVALAVNYCLIGPVPRVSADGTIVHPLIFEDEDADIDGVDGG